MASTARTGVTRGRTKRRSRSPGWWRAIKIAFAILVVAVLTATIIAGFYMFTLRKEAAEKTRNLNELVQGEPAKPSVIYAVDGTKLFEAIPERRDPVDLNEVPEFVQNAVLAAEDRRFRSRESAVDIQSLGRAIMRSAGGSSQGGSTLTMQLAKLLYSNSERTVRRKLQDIAIAEQLERQLTKDQILAMYLNIAYFGEGATGIGAAAKTYFGKKVGDLSYAEAAILARCVRRPSDQNPVRNYAKALENGHVVLGLMKEEGWITDVKYEAAMKTRPKLTKPAERTVAPIKKAGYFVSSVLAELKSRGIDISNGGYTVHTTLDLQLQGRVEEEVRSIVRNHRGEGVNTAAFLLVDRDGHILAMQGGLDYRKNHYNVVTQGGL
ncbi:penicillin-binding protein, partial [bacterium]